jgi:putative transcriptional regulator
MKNVAITRVKLDPSHPLPASDWTEANKLTEEEIHAAALSDPDAQPWTPEQLARARRRVDVRLLREKHGLTQEQFARRFGLRLETVRGWEDRTIQPDAAAVTLLRVIWAEPEAVRRVVAAE